MTSPPNSAFPSSPASPGTRHATPGIGWGSDCEVLVRRLRPANDLRGAAAPGRRHARGRIPLSAVRASRGDAHESHGDPARRLAGRADRRAHDPRATAGGGRRGGGGGEGGRGRRSGAGNGGRGGGAG